MKGGKGRVSLEGGARSMKAGKVGPSGRPDSQGGGVWTRSWVPPGLVGAVLVLGAFLRLRFLGYSDLQGDEARAMLMAARLVQHRDLGSLLLHKKGPAEILVPGLVMALGRADAGAARWPFALAGLAGLVLVMALGHRLWGPRAAVVAGVIVAVDGYLIAFSRIVQYQSLVLVTSVAAVLTATVVARRGRSGSALVPALVAGGLVGLGTWAHYEAVFALPPVLWLLGIGAARRSGNASPGAETRSARSLVQGARAATPAWLVCAAGFGLAAGLFYVPFVLNPHFAETWRYIAERRVGGGLLYNNLRDFFDRASFYNASYYVLAMGAGLIATAAVAMAHAWRRGRLIAAFWVILVVGLLAIPEAFQARLPGLGTEVSWAVFVFAVPGLALLASPRLSGEWRGMLLWFLGPFIAAGFLVTKPHTHFYTMVPAWALLMGWATDRVLANLGRSGRRRLSGGLWSLAAVLLAVLVVHQYVVYVRHTPEYKRVWPEARLPGYWTPFGDALPRGGYFGFPYSAGWEAVRRWFADGDLSGDYDSNEELLITGWYTLGAPRCGDSPRYYLVSWRPQDEEEIPLDAVRGSYHLWGVVRVHGMEKLWVYDREKVPGPPRTVDVETVRPVRPDAPVAVSQATGLPLPERTLNAPVGDAVLTGFDRTLQPRPGGAVGVTLLWRATAAGLGNASSFVHLVDPAGQTVAQSDGWPDCGRAPTSAWQPGEDIADPHAVSLPDDLPPGDYRLVAGMYDAATGRRWAVPNAPDDTLDLGVVRVEAPR